MTSFKEMKPKTLSVTYSGKDEENLYSTSNLGDKCNVNIVISTGDKTCIGKFLDINRALKLRWNSKCDFKQRNFNSNKNQKKVCNHF